MNIKTLKHWTHLQRAILVAGAMLLPAGSASAQPQVLALGGGSVFSPYYGYADGNTLNSAKFHTPCGLAIDNAGQTLLVADRDNNVIRRVDLAGGQTYTLGITNISVSYANLVNKPVAVAIDNNNYIYVLNQGNGANGSLYTFNLNPASPSFGLVVTNAVGLTNATGMALDNYDNIYVTVQSNKLITTFKLIFSQIVLKQNIQAGTGDNLGDGAGNEIIM